MDAVDKKILTLLQRGLAICEQPYLAVANEAGVSESDCLARITKLKQEGLIRRVSAFLNPQNIGYRSTLCAVHMPEEQIEAATKIINSFDEVTHNYLRDNEVYNVWFTVIAYGDEGVNKIIDEIESKLNLTVNNFSSTAFYKIKVSFNLEDIS